MGLVRTALSEAWLLCKAKTLLEQGWARPSCVFSLHPRLTARGEYHISPAPPPAVHWRSPFSPEAGANVTGYPSMEPQHP